MLQRLALLVVLALVPAVSRGQTINVNESNDLDNIINLAECNGTVQNNLAFTWTISQIQTGGNLTLLASDTIGCPQNQTNSAAKTTTITSSINAGNATGSFPAAGDTPVSASRLLATLGIPCNSASTSTLLFCIVQPGASSGSNNSTTVVANGSIPLDLAAPVAPVITSVSPAEAALVVNWEPGTGGADAGAPGSATSYNIYRAGPGEDVTNPPTRCGSVTGANTTQGRCNGLVNGTEYTVAVTAVSQGGNESKKSLTAAETPEPVNDFWRTYHNAGGREQGGCATGAAGLTALVLLVPLAFRRARRRS
ncbi:MAG TPA: fibronectin type III domain-containing protein [Anaeromyxobacteraceae bacterium]|nr:fibronectin type III domain-containing protein [Anaeromyxobacteraceae bacterium]